MGPSSGVGRPLGTLLGREGHSAFVAKGLANEELDQPDIFFGVRRYPALLELVTDRVFELRFTEPL